MITSGNMYIKREDFDHLVDKLKMYNQDIMDKKG